MRRMVLLLLLGLPTVALGGGGPFGIDHEWSYDNRGIWKRTYQLDLEYGVVATEVAGALWLGNDDALGHEFWQSIDSTAVSGVAAQVLKYAFGRERPFQGRGPNAWFKHGQSFPSGEVSLRAGFVTPIILGDRLEGTPGSGFWVRRRATGVLIARSRYRSRSCPEAPASAFRNASKSNRHAGNLELAWQTMGQHTARAPAETASTTHPQMTVTRSKATCTHAACGYAAPILCAVT
jgi:hypothetical protein